MSTKVKSHSITGFKKLAIEKKKIILLNLRSISFIAKRSLSFITHDLCYEGDGLVAVIGIL